MAEFVHGLNGYQRHHCRCLKCRAEHRAYARKTRGYQPSFLALEVERLNHELESAYLHIESLREENARLYCDLEERGTREM